MNIKDLILEAGGVSKDVYRYKIDISRIDPNQSKEDVLSTNIELVLNNDFSIASLTGKDEDKSYFKLQPYDQITIRPDPFFNMQKTITIIGGVYYPGVYSITRPDEKLSDFIERAGGLKPRAYPKASSIERNGVTIRLSIEKIIKNPKSSENIVMQNGDLINIAYYPDMVQVFGEVVAPGIFKYSKKNRVDDYIKQAGGFEIMPIKKVFGLLVLMVSRKGGKNF